MKRKNRKRIVSIVVIVMILVISYSPAVFAEQESERNYGYHDDVRIETYDVPVKGIRPNYDSELEACYSSLEQAWFPQNVRYRNQGSGGTCWAFSTANAADISYAKECSSNALALSSPKRLAYYFYHRNNDPLGLTGSDRNMNISDEQNWYKLGGNAIFTFQAMANRTGLAVDDEHVSNNGYPENGYDSINENDIAYFTEKAVVVEYSDYINMDAFRSKIKSMIKEYGAVAVSLNMKQTAPYYNTNSNAMYYDGDERAHNHAVTLVGWDDNYDKSNFCEGNQPTNNGAWIVLNSWGSNSNDNNVFHLSYEDKCALGYYNGEYYEGTAVAYDMAAADETQLYQHDGTAGNTSYHFVEGYSVASVFTAKSYIELKSVGFTEFNNGPTSYDIKVYKGKTDDSITKICKNDPVAVCDINSTKTIDPGYYSFDLTTPAIIKRGETFCIVVTFKTQTSMGVETTYENAGWIKFVAGLKQGESYYRDSDSSGWKDTVKNNYCLRIKGIAGNLDITTTQGLSELCSAVVANLLSDIQKIVGDYNDDKVIDVNDVIAIRNTIN